MKKIMKTTASIVVLIALATANINAQTAPINILNATALPAAVGSVKEVARFGNSTANSSKLIFYFYRHIAGADWTSAETRMQAQTDVTNQGYVSFNPRGLPGGLSLGTSAVYNALSLGASGNIGIGTGLTAPTDKLEVRTANQNEGISIKYGGLWAQFFGGGLTPGAYGSLAKLNDAGIIFGGPTVGTSRGFVIAPWSATADGFRVNENGTVTIGTVSSSPNPAGYNLYVNNGILTEKVKVAVSGTANWADYVFHKDYKLMPLAEVEQFVRTNNHLPNLPSAAEMVKEGNDLGKTDTKLLEKIEELTLYIIEMKKIMEEQNKKIEWLESKLK